MPPAIVPGDLPMGQFKKPGKTTPEGNSTPANAAPIPPKKTIPPEEKNTRPAARENPTAPVPTNHTFVDYLEQQSSVNLEFSQLQMLTAYRLVHADGVDSLRQSITDQGFSFQHPLIVKRLDDEPLGRGKYSVMDGMHRMTAMTEMLNEFGEETFRRIVTRDDKAPVLIPCLILKKDTPKYLLTTFARTCNTANTKYTAMSWMDSAYSMAQNAIEWTKQHSPEGVWVAQNHGQLYTAFGADTNWSDFQKKMGIVSWCCMKQDAELLANEALMYRQGSTPRTMFMMALLMDELKYDDLSKFRSIYKYSLDPDYARMIPQWSFNDWKTYPIWRELNMYPSLFTRGRMTNIAAQAEYLNPDQMHSPTLLMKAYFFIGNWMVNPTMSYNECGPWRTDTANYINSKPELVRTFKDLLALSEPSGTMADCVVWQCAKTKSTKLKPKAPPVTAGTDTTVTLPLGD